MVDELQAESIVSIKANAPEWADHYMILFKKVKYLQKTNKPTIMTRVVQFVFNIRPL